MISREDFLSIPKVAKEIQDEENRIAVMRSKLYSPRGLDTSDKVQSSGSQTALADIVIDMEQKLEARETELERLQVQAQELIQGSELLDGDTIVLMLLRYTANARWSDIAETMHYGIATIYRMHSSAIDILFGDMK